MDKFDTIYQKSINNIKCIGPCYEKNTRILHPITLTYVTSNDFSFCPTNIWESRDGEKKKFEIIAECNNINKQTDINKITMEMLLPTLEFNNDIFLKLYYNIHSFSGAIKWVNENQNLPYNNIKRILDCAWIVYGLDLNLNLLNDNVIYTFIEIIKKYWMKYIYNNIGKYIQQKKKKKIKLSKNNNNNINKYRIEKINFIITKFVTYGIIFNFLTKYIANNKKIWYNITSHTSNMMNKYINFIHTKII